MAPSAPASPLALTIGRTILSLHGRTMPRAARCRSPFLPFQHGQQMRLGRAPAPLNVVRAFSLSSSLFSSLLSLLPYSCGRGAETYDPPQRNQAHFKMSMQECARSVSASLSRRGVRGVDAARRLAFGRWSRIGTRSALILRPSVQMRFTTSLLGHAKMTSFFLYRPVNFAP